MIDVVGIDIGSKGAAALHQTNGSAPIVVRFLQYETEYQVAAAVRPLVEGRVVYIEDVSERPYEAHQFQFGYNAGFIYGAVVLFASRVEFITAETWQLGLSLGGRIRFCKHDAYKACEKCAYASRKKRFHEDAKRRNPKIKVTQDMADAILIAQYGFNLENNINEAPKVIHRLGSGLIRRTGYNP